MDPHSDRYIVYLQLFLNWLFRQNTPGACLKVVALPLYKPQKGVDQAKEGQGQSLVDLGTVSHCLMDREAVTRMSGLYQSIVPHWLMRVMSGTLRDTQYILNQMTFKSKKYKFISLIIKY